MGYTDQVQMEYDFLISELEIFIEVLQRDLASMVRTQEQATYVLNCPASDEDKERGAGTHADDFCCRGRFAFGRRGEEERRLRSIGRSIAEIQWVET
jgi:hypothetical protein